ncbi:MAG: YbaN family protein, partial [Promethearchaeia archaeon]
MEKELKEESDENRITQKNSQKDLSPLAKKLYFIIGFITLTLGIIGIVLPILPTTPFLLLSAGCFARSSEKFYRWLINHKLLGAYIRNYREGTGMPIKIKIFTITLLWLTILVSIFFLIKIQWIK